MKLKILRLGVIGTLIISLLIFVFYPIMYKNIVIEYSRKYELDPFLVLSVIKRESSFDESATSNKNARGLMQISDTTGNWAAESLDIKNYSLDLLYDPENNIRIGTWYLNKLKKQFADDETVLAAYNAGSGNVQTWLNDKSLSQDGETLDVIPFNETREYVSKVQKSYFIYKNIYWHPYFLENGNIFDDIFLNARKKLIEIIRKLR